MNKLKGREFYEKMMSFKKPKVTKKNPKKKICMCKGKSKCNGIKLDKVY